MLKVHLCKSIFSNMVRIYIYIFPRISIQDILWKKMLAFQIFQSVVWKDIEWRLV